jgi:hypothetical protein
MSGSNTAERSPRGAKAWSSTRASCYSASIARPRFPPARQRTNLSVKGRSRPLRDLVTTAEHVPRIRMKESFVSAALLRTSALALLGLVRSDFAGADDLTTYTITLQNHHFTPAEIHVPTGKPFIVVIRNANDGPDEFEMLFPALERPLEPGQQGKVRVRPLPPGRFPFFGESDPDNETGAFFSE